MSRTKSTRSIPVEWRRQRVIPSQSEDFCGPEEMITSSNVSHQPHHLPVIGSGGLFYGVGVVDSDEEMEPFDVESFVDRLVEDDPPPWRGNDLADGACIWEAPVAAAADTPSAGVITKNGNIHTSTSSSAAKLFLQPIHSESWPERRQTASANGAEWRRACDKPIVVPHDTFLDALFTPARISSPEVLPGVDPGFVRVPNIDNNDGGSRGGRGVGMAGFEPSAIYNIPPLVEPLPVERQVPWAPARPDYGGFRLPSPGAKPVESAFQIQLQQQKQCHGTTLLEGSNNVFDLAASADAKFGSTAAATAIATPTPLIGADSFSEEYDDDRHAFLRQQEIFHLVGPGYLARTGQPGLVTPSQRTALVDWLSKVHAAAPASSGGGPPLSLEALFLAVNLVDRFLSTPEGGLVAFRGRRSLKLAGAACLGLASKYEDTQPTSLWGLAVAGTSRENELGCGKSGGVRNGGSGINNCSEEVSNDELHAARKDVAAMELRVASALSYRLTVPTALSFLGVFIRRASLLGYLPEGPAAETVRTEAQQILLRVLHDATWLEHMPSALAAAALYWASCITAPGAAAPSSFAFFAVTGYQLESLCRCLRDMEAVRTGGVGGGLGFGWAGAAFPEHAGRTLFGAGGGHPAIAAL